MRMNHYPAKQPSPVRQLAGWLVLLVFLGALSPVGPALAALLGGLDRDHQVCLATGNDGVRVVLHHGACCQQGHHHGVIARTLTLFAQPATTTDPDHVLQFHSASAANLGKQLVTPKPLNMAAPVLATPPLALMVSAHEPVFSRPTPRPPPDAGGEPVGSGTTVLLI